MAQTPPKPPSWGPTFVTPPFDKFKLIAIAGAFGTLVIVGDLIDQRLAGIIAASLFTVMLFTTDMGSYLAHVLDKLHAGRVV